MEIGSEVNMRNVGYKVFHGNFPNTGNRSRRLMAIAYRPAWAGPTGEVETWDPEEVAKVPPAIRRFFRDRNERNVEINVSNKPPGMKSEAPGINPSRWSLRDVKCAEVREMTA